MEATPLLLRIRAVRAAVVNDWPSATARIALALLIGLAIGYWLFAGHPAVIEDADDRTGERYPRRQEKIYLIERHDSEGTVFYEQIFQNSMRVQRAELLRKRDKENAAPKQSPEKKEEK